MRNLILGLLFLVFLVSISGCQTVANTARGVGVGVGTAVAAPLYGFGKGLVEDAYGAWEAVERADEWIKENYW